MTYELAKQLNDAGFPQEIKDGSFYFAGLKKATPYCWGGEGEDKPYDGYVLCPTLSELIKACPKIGFSLGYVSTDDEGWHCSVSRPKYTFVGYQETAEEAVAKLWLAIYATPHG